MTSDKYMAIGEVVRLTGLTERALRYYEERSLLQPIRTAAGRRAYSGVDLTRVHHITLLRQASFSLSQIKGLLDDRDFDLASVINVQIDILEIEQSATSASLNILYNTRSVLSQGGNVDLEALCELIKIGDQKMKNDAWQEIYDRYYTPEEQKSWKAAKEKLADSFNREEYEKSWKDLAARIEQALPLDPASPDARSFVEEWNALLAPFLSHANDQMKAGASRLWSSVDDWGDGVDAPISKAVWCFVRDAQACARD